MRKELRKPVVYYDRYCPLCRLEIGYYRRKNQSGVIGFVDVAETRAAMPDGITRQQALKRFDAGTCDGRGLSGAAAFAEVWSQLPTWRWASRATRLPGALVSMELSYGAFLPIRPLLSRLFGTILRSSARRDVVRRT